MKVFKRIVCVVCIIAVVTLTIKNYNPIVVHKILNNAALLSAITLLPSNVHTIRAMSQKEDNAHAPVESQITESKTDEASPNTSSSPEQAPDYNDQDAVGKVTDKLITAASANLIYNSVSINNQTGLKINIADELKTGPKIKLQKNGEPQVLILHTHATESYMTEEKNFFTESDTARSTDESKNIIVVGNIIKEKIQAAGFNVIHDKTLHDNPSYTGGYDRAAETIKSHLINYPSIKIVIDVHRDSIGNDTSRVRPVAEIDGKKSAQVMLVVGSETGAVTGFPNWMENFRLALRVQQSFEVLYPNLSRPMMLASKKYNQHLTTGSLLVEIGSDTNTFSQASYAGELVGNSIVSVLNMMV